MSLSKTTSPSIIFDIINKSFSFQDSHVNVIIHDSKPWFRGKDVVIILGYSNLNKALGEHVSKKYKVQRAQLGKPQNRSDHSYTYNEGKIVYISEAGLYELIFSSKLPIAQEFKHWVFENVLPNIRQVGQERYIQQLEEQAKELARLRRESLALNDYVRNIELLKKDQIFYLATTRAYATRNRFEFGGVKHAKDLKGRFNSYNTGRAEGDLMYITKIFKCNKYELIEERLHVILRQFKDKPESRKEMIHLRYDLLTEVVDFVCDNFDREVEFINKRCQEFLDTSICSEPIIPEPLDLGDFLEISVNRGGVRKEARIDISDWSDEQIYAKIEEIVELCARETKKMPYNLRSQKDSVKMELAWSSLTPYMKKLAGLSLSEWRAKFKDWYRKTQPTQLLIKGVSLAL